MDNPVEPMKPFFSCDWGTTSFRLRRVDMATGRVVDERREPTGARTLYSQSMDQGANRETVFADFLRQQLLAMSPDPANSLQDATVVISGMASSSIGWRELPYAKTPAGLDGSDLVQDSFDLFVTKDARVTVQLVSGLCTDSDVMRGEETEILGLFAGDRFATIARGGVVVLPGTHSKHVKLVDRRIVDFHTFMSGELFDVLSAHSVLRASLQIENVESIPPLSDPACRTAFVSGVQAARDDGLARSLFQTRVRTVMHAVSPAVNRWFLSGLLIGGEVADLRNDRSDTPVLLAAAEPLSAAYQLALEAVEMMDQVTVVPPDELSLASVRGQLLLSNRGKPSDPSVRNPE
jgi:2-dehydro-3-deoxygalactonokinase